MSVMNLNTTPLFQTSLRDWQANWKARQGDSGERTNGGSATRLGRFARRPRRSGGERPRS